MSQACNFRRAHVGLRRPAAISAAVFSSIVLLSLHARAEPIEFDHDGGAVAPIEIVEPSTPMTEFESESPAVADEPFPADPMMEAANEPVPADPMMEAASEEAQSEVFGGPETGDTGPANTTAGPSVETAAKPVSKKPEKATSEPAGDTDIFHQWSRKKFKRRREAEPHPLAAARPDHFVVVCQANCDEEKVHVVYLERMDARGPVNEKPIKSGIVAGTETIDCVGGCYTKQEAYASASGVEAATDQNGWVTNVKKNTPEKEGTSSEGRWFDRIN